MLPLLEPCQLCLAASSGRWQPDWLAQLALVAPAAETMQLVCSFYLTRPTPPILLTPHAQQVRLEVKNHVAGKTYSCKVATSNSYSVGPTSAIVSVKTPSK